MVQAANAVTVAQQVIRGRYEGEGFPELLGWASHRGGRREIEMQNVAALMRQDNKDVKDVKGEGGDDEEVDRPHAEVIAQESLPGLGRRLTDSWDHVFGDGALGNGQAMPRRPADLTSGLPIKFEALPWLYWPRSSPPEMV
jgi:hypothetical protein